MSKITIAIVAVAAGVVMSAAEIRERQAAHGTQSVFPAGQNVVALLPVSGTWTADYEKGEKRMIQVLTINGVAPAKAPDADAAKLLFADQAPGFVAALAAPGAFPIAVARDVKQFSSGRLRVQFKLIGGATDQSAGIFFGLQPDGSYTFARYNTKDGNVAIWKFEKGQRTVLVHGEAHEQLPLNQWHTLDVNVTGPAVAASVNGGRLPVRYTLPAPVEGRVGVWTKADSVTAFKEFSSTGGHHTLAGSR